MAKEIERKFLVINESFKREAFAQVEIAQGYLSSDPSATVRVRLKGNHGYLTVKGITKDAVRDEWEYEIPIDDAREMLNLCKGVLAKTRWLVKAEVTCMPDAIWEVDEFHSKLEGLIVAEIELPEANAEFARPSFIGEEVTGDPRYYNSSLVASMPDGTLSRRTRRATFSTCCVCGNMSTG